MRVLNRCLGCTIFFFLSTVLFASTPPVLPIPKGRKVVRVSTESQLQAAIKKIRSNTTILIAPGTYTLTNTVHIASRVENVELRGGGKDRNAVILMGPGMGKKSANVPHGIMVSKARNVLIANLSVGNVFYHPIALQAASGCQKVRIYNVRMFDAGEQFLKASAGKKGVGVSDSVVEYCVFEYSTHARSDYTNGVDVHQGKNWIIRHNIFRNIRAPKGKLAGPSVLMWNHSSGTVCENNLFVNCQRGIAFGLVDKKGFDHEGGIIQNNVFYRSKNQSGDAAIMVFDSPHTKVLNNTAILSGTYPTPIEYRFKDASGLIISNNNTDGKIWARNGAMGKETGNRLLKGPALAQTVAEIEAEIKRRLKGK